MADWDLDLGICGWFAAHREPVVSSSAYFHTQFNQCLLLQHGTVFFAGAAKVRFPPILWKNTVLLAQKVVS